MGKLHRAEGGMDIRRGHRLVIGRSLVSAIRLIGLSVPMIGCITRGHPRSDTKKDRQTNEWEEIWIYEDLPTCCTLFLFFFYECMVYGSMGFSAHFCYLIAI